MLLEIGNSFFLGGNICSVLGMSLYLENLWSHRTILTVCLRSRLLMGTTFGMDKKQRIQTFASGSSHAMTLMAVDLDANGQPKKWMVENSWGPGANNGHLIMTDEWFNEYMFRLVVNKKFITDKVKEVLKQTPTRLPAWDPMFAEEE